MCGAFQIYIYFHLRTIFPPSMNKLISPSSNENINKYKVAFFDIDGTIFKSDYSMSPKTVQAIKTLQKMGIKCCLATGRPYFGSLKVISDLGIKDASMFASGGVVILPESKEVVFTDAINDEQLILMLHEIKKAGIHTELYSHDSYFIEGTNHISDMHLKYLNLDPSISTFEAAIAANKLNKIVSITESEEQLLTLRAIADRYPAYSYAYSYGASHPGITFLNITSKNASRKKVFEFFLKYFGVDASETIAFGDADADITFLENAGAGIAVGNATIKAKEAAKYVTLSVEEDGVVYALQAMGVSIHD